jgi:cyclophilin family peptidyl-prolyl cis-trans isomerase
MRRNLSLLPAICLFFCGCSPKAETPALKEGEAKTEVKPCGEEPKTDEKDAVAQDKVVIPKLPSFRDAVLLDPIRGEACPPDLTAAGKNVGKIFEAIAGTTSGDGLWDQVQFHTPEGKRIRYRAKVRTDLGVMDIELLADSAPNHVRNFIALARAGYYEGLCFHRSFNKEFDKQPWRLIEAGCPKGTGEIGYGSVGYWLKPEIDPELRHEEGSVGAWYTEDIRTASSKFYVTLTPSPWMDERFTIFGKIVGGLDVARTINAQPVRTDDSERPLNPVVIREVAIVPRIE